MSKSFREVDLTIKRIEDQIIGLRDEIRDMMATLGKLSQEFSKVLLVLSRDTSEVNESFKETKWGEHSFS
ncbi:MAG: hypothetical protein ACE5I5_03145 [Candidatus Heimdallarchaeota archaeon]